MRNGAGLGGLTAFTGGRKAKDSWMCLVSHLGTRAEYEERPQQVCYRYEHDNGGMELGGIEGEVKICNWLTYFPSENGLWVPKERLLELRAGTKQWVGGTEVWRERSV